MSELENRRPLKTRGQGWSRNLAARLAAMGVTPDALSASSLVFAGVGAGLFWVSGASDGPARASMPTTP